MRITGVDGMRVTRFATDTADRSMAELELRHRLRAGAEDRIRAARATGLRNLLLRTTAQNKVWLEIAQLAVDLPGLDAHVRAHRQVPLRGPRRLLLRLSSAAGQLLILGRRRILRRPGTGPGPATSPPHADGSHSCRTPADQQIDSSLRQPFTTQSRGTRRNPETTLGPSACTDSAHDA
ncbi:hypothetical protein [Streptomyces flaveolus]|uniref:hypothetical protein n=1 Tax=Streptomyces flaveolus TaxID=67297 RepID=UPI003F4BF6C1